MRQPRFDDAARAAFTACVSEIEKNTDAELVLTIRSHSGSYRHADYLCGAILAFLGLLFLLFSPLNFGPYWVVFDVIVLFALGAFVSSRSSFIRRLLSSASHRRKAARTSAAAMFYEAGIANTEAEMGVLVYVSLLERRLEVIADRGILKTVPAMEWNEILFELHQVGKRPESEALLSVLKKFGCVLAAHLPPSAVNPNELPDAPRFEL